MGTTVPGKYGISNTMCFPAHYPNNDFYPLYHQHDDILKSKKIKRIETTISRSLFIYAHFCIHFLQFPRKGKDLLCDGIVGHAEGTEFIHLHSVILIFKNSSSMKIQHSKHFQTLHILALGGNTCG
jgi:hypothetical protein